MFEDLYIPVAYGAPQDEETERAQWEALRKPDTRDELYGDVFHYEDKLDEKRPQTILDQEVEKERKELEYRRPE